MSAFSRPRRAATGAYLTLAAVASLVVLTLPACRDDGVGPADTPQDQLLFLSTRVGGTDELGRPLRDIYRVNADGTGVEDVTQQPAWLYSHLDLSPDGTRIAYISGTDCNIWVRNVDGAEPTRLTNLDGGTQDGCNASPHWSRDGARIAFASNRAGRSYGAYGGFYDAWVMNADGSDPHDISHSVTDGTGLGVDVLAWSGSGQVAFEASIFEDGVWSAVVYVANVDGTGVRPLFNNPGDHSPAWSPDGSKIAFISERDGRARLYLMNADGSGEHPLTDHAGDDHRGGSQASFVYDPWSPDGTRIAFDYDAIGEWGTYVINADGSGLTRLSDHPTWFNGWSSSGDRIAFTDRRVPNDVYVVNADGTGLFNLTDSSFDDSDAVWVPAR
jgi:Tol biopolymer transport system component